ncbi:MAG TPA: DUF11 domain-containing protein, partial [Vicinamibacteria bacterium]|nr:DUF11 domain-containing protein [Vicinamibacteria bacterium]
MKQSLLALALVLVASVAGAQPYEIDWWTVDGGGAMNGTGGAYTLSGTIGQPDAGGPYTGAAYSLHSGFWAIAAGGGGGPQADLGITKTDGASTAVPGQAVTYTIVATNAGPSPVTNATVTDAPPATLTGVSWTCTASAGSSCPASGTATINAPVSLVVGGSATFTLTGTIAPTATGTLANTAAVTVPAGVTDPNAANDAATDTDTLTPQADLALALSDAPDPVVPGANLTYTVRVTNIGPSASPSMTVTQTLPGQVAFASASAGCTHAAGTVTCTLGSVVPSAFTDATVQVTVAPGATGGLTSSASVTGGVPDPVSTNNADTESTTLLAARAEGEVSHGLSLRADLAAVGGQADVDLYRIRQQPHSSYEVALDAGSGDFGASGARLDRVTSDGTTVLQTSGPVGTGAARSLRFRNDTSSPIDDQLVRVTSPSCGTGCGADDAYRLRAWETTVSIPRFNNSSTQVTVVLLQNSGATAITGRVYFW